MSPNKFDRVESAVRRVHDDLQFRSLDVTNFTRSLDAQQRAEWTASVEGSVEGEVVEPEDPTAVTTTGGEDVAVDAEIFIRDDPSFMVAERGDTASRATEFDDSTTGRTYAVLNVFDEGNGLYRLDCTEV